jgi:hypothetical protein
MRKMAHIIDENSRGIVGQIIFAVFVIKQTHKLGYTTFSFVLLYFASFVEKKRKTKNAWKFIFRILILFQIYIISIFAMSTKVTFCEILHFPQNSLMCACGTSYITLHKDFYEMGKKIKFKGKRIEKCITTQIES